MDTRLTTHGTWRLLSATIMALALVMALGVTSASAASPTACRVQNTTTGGSYTALQAAVDAASKADRLLVKGTCMGTTIIGKKLVIEGVRTATSGKPTLSGGGQARVIEIRSGHRVRLRGLEIVRGRGSALDDSGGGILNRGVLTLVDVVVRHNRATTGGGIYNDMVVTMTGSTRILENKAYAGGGVFNGGWLTMDDSATISGNRSTWDGGGVWSYGIVRVNDASSIHDNRADHWGGGVLSHSGTIEMSGAATIRDNRATHQGGGVSSYYGTITMQDASSIHANRAGDVGGGVAAFRVTRAGVVCSPAEGANVVDNSPEDCHLR
jgi:hypothetical protein